MVSTNPSTHHTVLNIILTTCSSSVTVEENEQVVAYALSKRPNVKLVETNLTFGREGFTSYRGKTFHPSLKLTRRYYPHTYNVDGFFVAKFQKVAATPANAVLVDRSGNGSGGKSSSARAGANGTASGDEADDVVDRTPITDDETATQGQDDFGGFDDDEDEQYIEKGKRNAMRRRGLDPSVLNKAKKDGPKAKKEDGPKTKKDDAPKAKKEDAPKTKKEDTSKGNEEDGPKPKPKARSKRHQPK